MDSKIKKWCEMLLAEVNRVTAFHRHGQKVSAAMLDRLSNYQVEAEKKLALLIAEPGPCENMDEIIDSARISRSNTDTYTLISAYASQVADNRAEELRAQIEMLRRVLKKCSKWALGMDYPRVQIDEALAATEPKSLGGI